MKRFFKISIQFASVGFFLLIAWAMLLSRGFACGSFALFEIELLIVALAFCWRFDTKKLLKSTSLYFRQGYQKNAYNNKIHNNRSLPFCESIKHVKFSEAVAENSEKYVKSEKEKNVAAFSRKETVIYEYNLTKNIPETKESELYGEFGRLNCGFNERNVLWANFNVHPDEQKKYIKIMNSDNLISDFMNGISSYDFDFRLMVQNSAPEWMNLNVKTIKYSDSSDIKAFFIIKNINEKKQKEFEIERKSELDVLTDVFNRTAIIEKIQSIFKNEPLSQHALIMFDIDNFKHINDTYGHIFGDKILSNTTNSLKKALRADDLVGRIGGDEFVILLHNVLYDDVLKKRVELICKTLSIKISNDIFVMASLGVAVYPRDGTDFITLYRHSDLALYHTKNTCKGKFSFYSEAVESADFNVEEAQKSENKMMNDIEKQSEIILQNIIDNKKLLQKKQDEYENYRLVMDISNSVVFKYDFDENIFTSSDGFYEYAITDSEIKQIFFSKDTRNASVHPLDFPLLKSKIFEPITSGSNKGEAILRLKLIDGTYRWCHLICIVVRGENEKIKKSVNMITAVNFKQETANIQLEAILNHMAGGVMILECMPDDILSTLYISPGFYKVICQNNGAFSKLNVKDMIFESDYPRLISAIKKGLQENTTIDCTYRVIQFNGETGWRHSRAVRIPYENCENPVIIAIITDVTEMKKSEQRLMLSNERMKLAFAQTDAMVWEIDVPERSATMWDIVHEKFDSKTFIRNLPQSLVDKKMIHSSSVKDFCTFFANIINGVPNGECAVQIKKKDVGYGWAKLRYNLLFDKLGVPYKAVAIMEWIANISDAKSRFEQEILLFRAVRLDFFAALTVNLSTGLLQSVFFNGTDETEDYSGINYNHFVNMLKESSPNEYDKVVISKQMSADYFWDCYQKGTSYLTVDYRRKDANGKIFWTSSTINILSTPIKNDVYAFIYMRDIDTRKKWELELDCRIERDKNTTLYLPQTMEAMTEHIIKSLKRGSLCAFMLFDMTKLPAIKESNAPVVVWRILASTSRLFKIILDSKYIVGRTSEDKVAVFLPTVKSIEDVESHAKYFLETIEHMRKKAGINEDLGYAVGISVSDSDKASYNSMYENSLAALGDSNEKISFFKNKNLKRSAIPFEQNGNYLLLKPDNDSADEDRDFAFSLYQCCAALIKGDNFKESLKEASTIILKYYNATRVFSLKYFKPNKILTIIGEISIDNSTSIWHSSQNIPLSAFPFLENISAKSQSVLISSEINSQNPTVNFIVSPIIIEGDLRGFICIENPLLHSNVTSLMNSIIPIIAKEFERRTETQKVLNLCNLDTMTGLYNRSNFYKTLSEINISSVISLGLLCSDVNGLKKINKDFGTEYGDTILKFIADVFVKEFGVGNVFRISGDEFTVILLNCTYNSFVIKCNNLSAEINKKYGDRISVGYAWSEKDIMPHKMFENADSICRLAKQDYYRLSNDLMISKHNENKMEFCKIIKDGGFIVYLQPKANILTDEIYGAEALVRCNHPKLGFLTPEKFISDFEKYNIVRDLDFFVLEFTFKLMMSWKKEFGRFIPVSVNFSRQTLIDPSAVDALKLLLLKYEVPASFIEIEITETIGDVERTTASAACERLLSLGFKLALDDFGSAYSSLSVLSNVKFDTVKLDKSLINDIVSNKESYIIAENVVLMCKKLGSSCIAEGVETPEQIAALKSINCNLAQGYYYNKPIPSNEFTKKYIALNDTEKKD